MPESSGSKAERLQLVLRKHWLGWHPKPTVVFGGRGQPAQWGTGTWQAPADKPTTVQVYLFNRMWAYGRAEYTVEPSRLADGVTLVYSAPWLPFLAGRLRAVAA
jgi:hypothetical protein